MIVVLNKENFKKEVLNSEEPVLVDFFTFWCPPCRVLSLILEELAETYKNKIKFAKLNVEETMNLAQEYEVMSVPTLIIFKNGKEIKRVVGLEGKEKLKKILDSL